MTPTTSGVPRIQAQWVVRAFLSWSKRVRELPKELLIPSRVARPSTEPIDGEERWRTAEQLLTDDTIDTADRVAAALVGHLRTTPPR